MQCQKNIESDLEKAIENDTKTEKVCDILPYAFSQLTVWNKKFIFENIDIIYKTLNGISEEWMLNLISLEDGKSYIIANNERVKKKLERLFDNTFMNDILQLDDVWLRKEIIKKARSENII